MGRDETSARRCRDDGPGDGVDPTPRSPPASDMRRLLSRAIRRSRRLATAVFVLAAACGDDAVAPLPESGPPAAFVVRADGFGYGSLTVTLTNGALVVVRAPDWRAESATATTIVPTDADWAAFWREARAVGLQRWPRRCEYPGISDGSGIAVDITYDGGRIQAETMSAYPTGEGGCVRGAIDPTGEYTLFTAAVGRLIGRPFP